MTIEKFEKIEQWMSKYTLFGTPIYFEFLAGKRDLSCSAWAIPTRNIRGWKGPCYLMTDAHYSSYQELLDKVEWAKYGVENGVVKDSPARDLAAIRREERSQPDRSVSLTCS